MLSFLTTLEERCPTAPNRHREVSGLDLGSLGKPLVDLAKLAVDLWERQIERRQARDTVMRLNALRLDARRRAEEQADNWLLNSGRAATREEIERLARNAAREASWLPPRRLRRGDNPTLYPTGFMPGEAEEVMGLLRGLEVDIADRIRDDAFGLLQDTPMTRQRVPADEPERLVEPSAGAGTVDAYVGDTDAVGGVTILCGTYCRRLRSCP